MIAMTLFSLAVGGALGVFIMCQQMWHTTELGMQTTREANLAMSRLVYGVGINSGLRAASTVAISSNANGWSLACSNKFDGAKTITYNRPASNIYWIDGVNQSSPIAEHVSAAVVSTGAAGVNIRLSVLQRDGRFTATNQISSFVTMRNRQ
jgi:hypothetical protein